MGGNTLLAARYEGFQTTTAGLRTRLVFCGGAGSEVERMETVRRAVLDG